MDRIRWMEPLINYLKTDINLNGHGNPDLIDLNGSNIFPIFSYDGFETINNFFHGVTICPKDGEPIDPKPCGTIINFDIEIGAMTYNPRQAGEGFQENIQSGVTFMTGAYKDGSVFEYQIRQAILGFNEALKNNLIGNQWRFQPLVLIRLLEPYFHNGLVVMRTLYRTQFTF